MVDQSVTITQSLVSEQQPPVIPEIWDYASSVPVIKGQILRWKTITLEIAGEFTLHSGNTRNFKIDCDALSDKDIEAIAKIISDKLEFSRVVGIPTGGQRLAKALERYKENTGVTLIVDDVLTTGNSMEEQYNKIKETNKSKDIVGIVIFARGKCPWWIIPIFELNTNFRDV